MFEAKAAFGFRRAVPICRFAAVLVALSSAGITAERDPAYEFFEARIQPVLVEHCFECHSAAAQKVQGGLRLDSRDAIRQGGDSGPAIVPGSVGDSLLLDALRHATVEMPPGRRLPAEVVADFAKWVEMGAPDPRDSALSATGAAELARNTAFANRRTWWSLLPLQTVYLPEPVVRGANWAIQPIDRFIFDGLLTRGLAPAEIAESDVLLRRLCFVLTGLPPSPEQTARFADRSSWNPCQAFAEVVDELLAGPHFGEHFARRWMDVIRYGDTYGYEWDIPAKGGWHFRDYLIRAYNADVGFDQLVREQIAGDLLPRRRINQIDQIDESQIGPMFFHLGEHRHGSSLQFNGIHQEMINNKIDALSKAFLATTVACARCHDHKLEAVSQRDYFALASVLMTPRWAARVVDTAERNAEAIQSLSQLRSAIRSELARLWRAEARSFPDELAAAFSLGLETSSDSEQLDRVELWLKALAAPEPDASASLEDISQLGGLLRSRLGDDATLASEWKKVVEEWNRRNSAAIAFNTTNFESLLNCDSDRLPEGWAIEGDGLRSGYVDEGTPLVALDGRSIVQRLLRRGYYTHALSPRLPGALRSPRLQSMRTKHISLQVAGDDWAASRVVPANAFLSENVAYFEGVDSKWRSFDGNPNVDRPDWPVWLELTTAALNSNFPGPTYLTKKRGLAPDADTGSMNGWFSLTGIVVHNSAETPQPVLNHWCGLFAGSCSESVAGLWRRVGEWLGEAVVRWASDAPAAGDVTLVNWLLERGLLANDQAESKVLAELVGRYRALERTIEPARTVNGMDERGMAATPYRLESRGNLDDLGPPVAHDFLEVFAGQNEVAHSAGSGRLELADFLVGPKNPLTARVYVNRVWQWVFGTGLVSTPDDFGHLGDNPSHPELLDWLATEFMTHGWSTKWLIRQLVLSNTFKQGSCASEKALQIDPQNRLLHHYPTRRLEAESIRDSMLAISGRLDATLFGPPIEPPRSSEDATKRLFSGPLDGLGRRSIYTRISLMEPPKFLIVFNFPEPKIPSGKRDATNVPAHALVLLNSPFVHSQAEYWSQQLIRQPHRTPAERLRAMLKRAFGREPAQQELERWIRLLETIRIRQSVTASEIMAAAELWAQMAHTIFNAKEFIYFR